MTISPYTAVGLIPEILQRDDIATNLDHATYAIQPMGRAGHSPRGPSSCSADSTTAAVSRTDNNPAPQ